MARPVVRDPPTLINNHPFKWVSDDFSDIGRAPKMIVGYARRIPIACFSEIFQPGAIHESHYGICRAGLDATPLRATEYETAGEMVEVYSRGGDILPLRLYLRGIGDGVSMYNTLLQSQGHLAFYCPPEYVGLVDA